MSPVLVSCCCCNILHWILWIKTAQGFCLFLSHSSGGQIDGLLCSGFHTAETRVLGPGKNCFQAHSACWQNTVPCCSGTKVPFFFLAVSRNPPLASQDLSPDLTHGSYISEPETECGILLMHRISLTTLLPSDFSLSLCFLFFPTSLTPVRESSVLEGLAHVLRTGETK